MRPLVVRPALLFWNSYERLFKPWREGNGRAEPVDLRLIQLDGHLDPTFPAALLHIENRRLGEGFLLHWLRADEQRDTELGQFSQRIHSGWRALYHARLPRPLR